ncbi:hypothetical protein ECL_04929 [Enterobacter cloacae subsp. cloacae ATCC 13047]|uniref:Uncharacterized protein n=1 Tax=Enterobacter cloacae subsp. cloacae (strain ATCC 13047 / DSM 30054 / NBRC 13535 / NCTC 10005 / WDCM 00083 / NCDC 279-56) TaxID=716541 RepID=A0A0H3CT66_ENTCC|nr:hypothetical protein ECL_04929 [Enterobacter cloacae subsp. cloacae ATCC 13047]
MNLNRVFKSSVRCVNYQVNYIKTSFHYFFEPARVPVHFCHLNFIFPVN